jgi:hypothetical protein
MTKTHSEQTAAITYNRFPRAYATGHACENMQDRSVAKVTKPKSITYENIEQKYRLKTTDLGKQNNK